MDKVSCRVVTSLELEAKSLECGLMNWNWIEISPLCKSNEYYHVIYA